MDSMFQRQHSIEDFLRDLSLLELTGYVRRDPQYPYPMYGTTGEVFRALYEWTDPRTLQVQSRKVVVKVLRGSSMERAKIEERVRREVATWRYLKHPNVTEFLGIACLVPGRPPGLVSRFIQRNNFLEYIGRHPNLKQDKARDVALGLQYLHDKRIVHGDLKADNVLVTDSGVAQLNDFGISRMLDVQGFTTKVMHSIRFTAPELMSITEEESDTKPTFQSDIFSLGMLFLQIFHGPDKDFQSGLPYNHVRFRQGIKHDFRLVRRIHEGERPVRHRYTPMYDQQWDLLCLCWHWDPAARPNITTIVNAL